MQQIDLCRLTLQLDVNDNGAQCTKPLQSLYPLIIPKRELADVQGLQALQRNGVTVGGIVFSYDIAFSNAVFYDEIVASGFGQVQDVFNIRCALVVIPVQSGTLETPNNVPDSILSVDHTGFAQYSGGEASGLFRPRVIWRGLNSLSFAGPLVSGTRNIDNSMNSLGVNAASYAEQSTLRDGHCVALPIHVNSKVTLGLNEGLYFVIETVHGMINDEGDTLSLAAGVNLFGVAAVKSARTNR